MDQAFDYVESVVTKDIIRVDGVRRSPERARMIMRSYARNQGHQIPYTTICSDIKDNDKLSINDDTVADYVEALRKLFVVEDMPAWNPNLRSKTAVRTLSTRHFTDPSIACAALHLSPADLIHDLKTFGLFFESLAVHDLRIYAESMNGEVYHYRDASGLEADAIIKLENGEWAAVEVKLSNPERIEEGALHLLKLKSIIDTDKMKAPKFLMVITATEYAYQRKDGVWVVPLGCLKP